MTLSPNNFAKDQPTKSSDSFANNDPTQGSAAFVSNKPEISYDIASGDNTSGGIAGGDFTTFGTIAGQGYPGGFLHFANRTGSTPTH